MLTWFEAKETRPLSLGFKDTQVSEIARARARASVTMITVIAVIAVTAVVVVAVVVIGSPMMRHDTVRIKPMRLNNCPCH